MKTIYVSLPLDSQETKDIGVLVQNDIDGNVLKINLTEGGAYYDLSNATYVKINIRNPYYLVETGLCTISDKSTGAIEYILGDRALAVRETYKIEVEVYEGSSVTTSAPMVYYVRKEFDEAADPTEEASYPLLTDLMLDISQLNDNYTTQETTRVTNENERILNENERVTNENERKESMLDIETRFNELTTAQQQDAEVIVARDGELSLDARINRDIGDISTQMADLGTQINNLDALKADKTYVDTELNDISVIQINKNLGKFDQTYMADELLQQIAGSASINAIPAPKSITTERVNNQAITPEKTNFFKLSTNLANHLTRVESKSVDVTYGTLTANAIHDTSDFIELIPNTTYTSNKIARKGFYDIDKNFISTDTIDGTWISPANAHYVRLVSLKVNWGISTQLNLGATLLPFEPYYAKLPFDILNDVVVNPEITTFFNVSSNLFDKNNVTENFVIDITGNLVANTSYCASDFIEITQDISYTVLGTNRVVYYDANKQFVSLLNTDTARDVALTFTPTQTKYMRLSVFMDRRDIAQLNKGNVLLTYEEAGNFIKPEYIPKSKTEEVLKDFIVDSSLDGTFNSSRLFEDYTSNGWATISSNNVYSMIDSIQTAYPNYITKQSLTSDLTGLEISAYHLKPQRPPMTNQKRYPTIFITTGTHGYERSSVINMYHLVKELCEHWKENELIEALRFNVNIIWIPIVNPYGWSVGGGAATQRYNSNGVDIARQFPDDWVLQLPTDSTYGGEAPLTEIEALNVKQIFDENPEIDVFYDYHNFGDAIDEYIWLATASDHTEQLGEALIKKMTRKWKQEFEFIPDETWLGYTNIMYQGTMHNYAYKTRGIERSGTFETNNQFHLDVTSIKYNQDSCKAGLESIVNFLLINLQDLI